MSKPVVMISSTARDLPDYRSEVMDACLRADTFPKMMEHLPALDADAVEASLAMVDESEIYIGVFAHRYGTIPEGHDISITEMEYNWAVEQGIPTLIFIIDDDVPVKPKDFDKGLAAEKLETLKEKLKKKKVADFFKSPDDLRGKVYQSLEEVKKQLEAGEKEEKSEGEAWAKSLHHTAEIPAKPEAFIAHPYTLLQVKGLIGRKPELEILTDWVTKPEHDYISIFNIVAIGGMGKSALTWHWFNNIAPQENTWEGRIWWSFYETDATFDNFITKTLAYVSASSLEEVKKLSPTEQQDRLFQILDNSPYLIVLDGLERILVAYARQDAAFLDDSTLDDLTANRIANAYGLPKSTAKSYIGKHRLRKTTDARIGHFLRQLCQIRKSKILVSTRLFPADLQNRVGQAHPKCYPLFLPGLSDQDALELWRAYGARGSREVMLPIFQSFDKHPLLLQLLASEVAEFRTAPGDFDAWKQANPGFNVFGLPLVQVQSHVLSYALKGLSKAELQTLQIIAGFRMPASLKTLKALLLERQKEEEEAQPVFPSVAALDQALTILEDKGLLGWDRKANRYDLHPIVRGVVWNKIDSNKQYEIHGSLRTHFEAIPVKDFTEVEGIEDLRPAIELYNSLVEMELYDEAFDVFHDQLDDVTLYRLSANNLRIELLERLFVNGIEKLPAMSSKLMQTWTIDALGHSFSSIGLPRKATVLREREKEAYLDIGNQHYLAIVLSSLSSSLQFTGQLFRAEMEARTGLTFGRLVNDSYSVKLNLQELGLLIATKGQYDEGQAILGLLIRIVIDEKAEQFECTAKAFLSQVLLLNSESLLAKQNGDDAWALADLYGFERDYVRAAYCQGLTALRLGDLYKAEERLHYALKRVRGVQSVNNELQILNAIAELYLKKNALEKAREHLDDVWDYAEQGPYPLFHADALNILAQIEIVEGNKTAAIAAATEAYQKAWCDGPPYAYHYGLENAKKLLKELGAPEPEMPAFDPSKFEPMPEIDLDNILDDVSEND